MVCYVLRDPVLPGIRAVISSNSSSACFKIVDRAGTGPTRELRGRRIVAPACSFNNPARPEQA